MNRIGVGNGAARNIGLNGIRYDIDCQGTADGNSRAAVLPAGPGNTQTTGI